MHDVFKFNAGDVIAHSDTTDDYRKLTVSYVVNVSSSQAPGKYVAIPRKYYDISTSGLKFTVTRGDQTHDIELTK